MDDICYVHIIIRRHLEVGPYESENGLPHVGAFWEVDYGIFAHALEIYPYVSNRPPFRMEYRHLTKMRGTKKLLWN